MKPALVSIHGGHSGQFCGHARDNLEDIVLRYIREGFQWIGLTEHMPPTQDRYLYSEELRAGMNAADVRDRFDRYMAEARRLQSKYRDKIRIFIGFETEAYSGSLPYIQDLLRKYSPDYCISGIHHVEDIPFDYSPEEYQKAIVELGGEEELYCRYFDLQYELIRELHPPVIAHFDLIRIYDQRYPDNIQRPQVQKRISRNLQLIAQLDLILDFNVAALRKGAKEPYITRPILAEARALGIAVVPGDDSHGIETAGAFIPEGIRLLQEMGFETNWRTPCPCESHDSAG